MLIAELYAQDTMTWANICASLSTGSTIIGNYLDGDVFQPSTFISLILTAFGWVNKEANISLILQSIAVGNDFNWWSIPY